MRAKEIQAEQAAAAGGLELRWVAREQRQGKVRLWLPEEAVKIGPHGPELRDPLEVYGKMVFDWSATLNTPSASELAQCTRELHDQDAYRVQTVAFPGHVARIAEKHECILAVQGTPTQRKTLQALFGGIDFRELMGAETRRLEQALKRWADEFGRPTNRKIRNVDEQIRAMTEMLREMGLSEAQIRKKLDERMEDADNGERGGPRRQEQQRREQWADESIDGTDVGTDVEMQDSARAQTIPETQTTYTDPQQEGQPWKTEGTYTQSTGGDSYIEGVTIGGSQQDVEMDDDEIVRPMTNEEIQRTWKRTTGEGSEKTRWKKGLGKSADKAGDWERFNQDPHAPSGSGGEGASGEKIHETRSNTRRSERKSTSGTAKTETTSEIRKEAVKHSPAHNRLTRGGQQRNKTVPPRGGQSA